MVEQGTHKPLDVGSNPTLATKIAQSGRKSHKRPEIPIQDLPIGRFLCLEPNFHPFADSPKRRKILNSKGFVYLFLIQSTPVRIVNQKREWKCYYGKKTV
jgi:hypothetical protein